MMRWDRLGYLSLVLLFLICAVSALVPDNATLTSSKPDGWFIANGVDTGQFTVNITNNSIPLTGYQVTFSVNNSLLGTLSVTNVNSVNGIAQTTFSTLKKSGDMRVNASVRYKVNDSDVNESPSTLNLTLFQQVDHDTPYRIGLYNYSNEMTVGTINPVQLGFYDKWGNPVDSRRNPPDQVEITVSQPSPQDGGIWGGSTWVGDATFTTDINGTISPNLKVNSRPGWIYVLIHPMTQTSDHQQAIADKSLWIEALPGIPWSIETSVEPTNNQTYADGVSRFHIQYLVRDSYGNTVMNRTLSIATNVPGEPEQIVGTNSQGLAMMMYGPKSSIGMIWINATSIDNPSVQSHQQVWFVSQVGYDMQLSANQQVMPSRDSNPGFTAQIIAKVTDVLGNPKIGEMVTFGNGTITYDKGPNSSTTLPSLSATSAVTDNNGLAIVNFTPGGFTTNFTDPKYEPAATARMNITATWNGTTREIPVMWKNYPYLSAETYTSKSQISVNDTVDITIMLKGDGWALQPKPADVVLVTDLAGGIGGAGLLASTQKADKAFVNNATNSTWIGLVSFGNNPNPYSAEALALYTQQENTTPRTNLFMPYNGSAWDWCLENPTLWDNKIPPTTIINTPGDPRAAHYPWSGNPYNYFNSYSDAAIDSDIKDATQKAALLTIVNNYQAKGGTDYAAGINAAIQVFRNDPYPGHAKAIILMGDGIPMMAPISPGSLKSYWPSDWYPRSTLGWEDESDTAINAAIDSANQAKAMGITIYAAGYKLGPAPGYVDNNTFQQLVSSPDCYYYTPDPSKLDEVLLAIQGRIQKEAGVNTAMDLAYNQIEVNSIPVDNTGADAVFDYVYSNGNSTLVNSYYTTNGTIPNHTPPYPYTFDQSAEWNGNPRQLTFSVGTVLLNQVWLSEYRLKVLKEGNINIFSNDSVVTFDGPVGSATLHLPKTFITGIANFTNTNVTTNILKYTNISQDTGTDDRSRLFITWTFNSTYTGITNVSENYYIITYDQTKYLVGGRTLTPYEANHERSFTMRIADLPVGWERFLPVLNVVDAPGPERPEVPPTFAPPPLIDRPWFIDLK
ncbi:MAG TPA: hypothetical protein VMS89_08940 [Methanoregulaceae archaeon]|nr:hypothetical protein [Methanoregulaceae archaeon]